MNNNVNFASASSSTSDPFPADAIAVIGMAGRFPGADSLSAFWRNLRDGVESIVAVPEADLIGAGVSDKALANPAYVKRAALMAGIDEFDAEFFGFTPQGARMMDPQHRLFLQCAWHALEDAGYDPAQSDGAIGVYGTSSASGYLLHNLMSHHDPKRIIGEGATFEMINLSMQNDKDYLATRVSHQFNLRGPALSIQTACSSSLVAVHLACQSLISGECEMALAGAASIRVPHHVGYWHEPGSMASASGHCRPFDVRADGTVFGSGVAIVVLKPLQVALDDGDRIHAVIRGSAINNDGSTKMNYAAPNAAGQADVIAEAHAVAECDPATVSFVETHGTGTPLGDPIEIEGLRQAFELAAETRPGPCVLGSVKSNIGHLEVASGIAGLVKAILCLEHRGLPGTLHYTSPNPELHLDRGPFVVRGEYSPWEWDGVRRAGVSSFGVGGTNVHIVLEEAPSAQAPVVAEGPSVLLLSARTVEALQHSRAVLATELSDQQEVLDPSDVAATLATRRKESIRMAAVVDNQQHAATVLGSQENENVFTDEWRSDDALQQDRIAFVFPGQGAQHVGMARGLYAAEPVFTKHFDECVAGFNEELGIDLRAQIFEGTAADLERTDRTQPALFAVEYALARLVESYGVSPAALAGHSIGEYVAATIAGVFDLPTAVKAVSMRGRLMRAAPGGMMVAVAQSPEAIAECLSSDVDVAAINDPGSCVVAGTEEGIRGFQERLSKTGMVARRVRTSHAFHSRLMAGVLPEFKAYLSRLALREPRIPLLSNITGTWMTAGEATDPATWANQIRSTVRFSAELDVLLGDPSRVLVEVGPGGTLSASATRHPRWSSRHRAVRLMRHHAQNRSDRDTFLLALGQLWAADVDVDWTPLAAGRRSRRVTLPGYPFDRQKHWVEHSGTTAWGGHAEATNGHTAAGVPAAAPSGAATNGTSQMEVTLQRIWAQCLGVGSIDRNANFFELGGDSLVAISVAMTAANDGLDLTPQDLYEHQTVAALAKSLTDRYAGGLSRQSTEDTSRPAVPPNVTLFVEHGLCEPSRWRIPLILKLSENVQLEDVRSVLTAITARHDALRTRIVRRDGTCEQHVEEADEFNKLSTRTLPDGTAPGTAEERAALLAVLDEMSQDGELSDAPLIATYVHGVANGAGHLVIGLHGMSGDVASREILLADLFTAFGQRLAGQDIVLQPVSTSWGQWSQRCAALAAHPAVLSSRGYWLDSVSKATLRVAKSATSPPRPQDLVKFASALTGAQTSEVENARRELRVPIDDILLAALGRTIGGVVGEGAIAVDLEGQGRSVLKPDVDSRRTVGFLSTVYPVALACSTATDARSLIQDVRETLGGVPHYGIGYGLLRYLHAPTSRLLGANPPADIFFSYVGTIAELPVAEDAPVQLHADTAMPVRETIPGLGHALELRAYRSGDQLHLDWWYDTRRLEPAVVESLARRFPGELSDLVADVFAEDGFDSAGDDLELIDLSSVETGSELHA
ncbi:MAG: polyketide synthase family protein [Mycobacterium sp.]|nr:polyketide synthase family protein [Mycobacterium sp.]